MNQTKILGLPGDIKNYIDSMVKKSLEEFVDSSRKENKSTGAKNLLKMTESRLYAIPVLKIKIKDDKERVEDLKIEGAPEHSKSLIRYRKYSSRIDPDEALEAMIEQIEHTIITNQFEVDMIEKALEIICSDPYYLTVKGKYFDGLDNESIAELLHCDATTVWRNRQRLIKNLAIRLYGMDAIE